MPDTVIATVPEARQALDTVWFTRCPVPTATGLAYKLGWLNEAFARDGIKVETLQDAPRELSRHHYDHRLPSLVREGGAMLAIGARSQGEATRLVGLTWIEERQSILVRPDSGITKAKDLKGKRLALPAFGESQIASHSRGSSISRGMSLHGYKGALSYAGLTFDDVHFVEVGSGRGANTTVGGAARSDSGLRSLWPFQAVADGVVDAIYVKGASAVDDARKFGLVVGVDLDLLPEKRFRVNNGTPRPITVHESFIEHHFDHLVTFLAETLRAADWARDNLEGVRKILQSETRGSEEAVSDAYRNGFHESLHPDLSAERLALLEQEKKFLWLHGFIDHDFDIGSWVDPRPLEAAWKLLARQGAR
jgi:ABC-type nitrate/sulfonate/bicarbonate transport system substrate-binding protein